MRPLQNPRKSGRHRSARMPGEAAATAGTHNQDAVNGAVDEARRALRVEVSHHRIENERCSSSLRPRPSRMQ